MNATFIFFIFAYFHHLYMDCTTGSFHLPTDNILLRAIPATAVTYSGHCPALSFKVIWGPFRFHSWRCAGWAMAFCSGCDSTIAANTVLHYTTWVPDTSIHMLMGGFIFYFWISVLFFAHKDELIKTCWRGWASGYLLFSGHSFLATFYREGSSIPRRYSDYAGIPVQYVHETGKWLAFMSVIFISILLIGLVIIYISIFSKLFRRRNDLMLETVVA